MPLGFTANANSDADASLPALRLLLTIEILTSLLHFIHQLLRRRKIKLILTGDNRFVIALCGSEICIFVLYCAQLNCDRTADAISGPSQGLRHSPQQLDHDPAPLWRASPAQRLRRPLLVPEEEDIPLKERVRRANKLSCQIGHPIQEAIIISIHVNAAGNGLRPFLISTKIAIFEFLFH